PALVNTLDNIHNKLPWIERLDIVTEPTPAAKELNIPQDPTQIDPDDDFKRENYFYRLAQAAVLKAIPELHQLGVPTKRPSDYFAEMVKSDDHMVKIRKHLVESQQRLALQERARAIREKRKFGKEIQQAVLQARKEEKRKLTAAVKASRKKSGKDRADALAEILAEHQIEYDNKAQKTGYHRAKDVANRRKINHKRDYKNKKYGHGGQKKRSKRNTLESTHSGKTLLRQFDPLKHQATPRKAEKILKERRKGKQKKRMRPFGRK
ncbi:unnamed protein product, partial [Dicrocoelium dendriticum]